MSETTINDSLETNMKMLEKMQRRRKRAEKARMDRKLEHQNFEMENKGGVSSPTSLKSRSEKTDTLLSEFREDLVNIFKEYNMSLMNASKERNPLLVQIDQKIDRNNQKLSSQCDSFLKGSEKEVEQNFKENIPAQEVKEIAEEEVNEETEDENSSPPTFVKEVKKFYEVDLPIYEEEFIEEYEKDENKIKLTSNPHTVEEAVSEIEELPANKTIMIKKNKKRKKKSKFLSKKNVIHKKRRPSHRNRKGTRPIKLRMVTRIKSVKRIKSVIAKRNNEVKLKTIKKHRKGENRRETERKITYVKEKYIQDCDKKDPRKKKHKKKSKLPIEEIVRRKHFTDGKNPNPIDVRNYLRGKVKKKL